MTDNIIFPIPNDQTAENEKHEMILCKIDIYV